MSCDYCTAQATQKVWKHYMCDEHYNEYQHDIEAQQAQFEAEGEYTQV